MAAPDICEKRVCKWLGLRQCACLLLRALHCVLSPWAPHGVEAASSRASEERTLHVCAPHPLLLWSWAATTCLPCDVVRQ